VVVIDNPIAENNKLNGIRLADWDSTGPHIEINNPTIIDCNTLGNTTGQNGSAIALTSDTSVSANVGNIHIDNPTIKDTRATKLTQYGIFCEPLSAVPLVDFRVTGRIEIEALVTPFRVNSGLMLEDPYRRLEKQVTANQALDKFAVQSLFHNSGAGGGYTLTAAALPAQWPDVVMEVRAAQVFRFDPDALSTVIPLGTGAGKYVQSNVVGSRIRLRRATTTTWQIVEQIGTWTAEP
jgi:hypothetical protein